jgi:hypothetical protein
MFYIEDGREHFYQWDVDRRLVVEDPTIKEVHFCNRTDNCSLVCEVYFHDNDFGGIHVVNVPNILLQTDWKIRVYAYDGKHTKHDECFEVKTRTKPADYVYTETEIKNWEALELELSVKPGIKISQGEIFNDYANNLAVNDYSHAEGTGTWASGKVFKVLNAVPHLDNTGYIELDSKEGIEVGMTYSIVGESAHHHCGKVIEAGEDRIYIKVENFPIDYQRNPKEDEKYSIHNYFMIDGHPELGTTEIGFAAHAEGYGTKATNTAAHAEGRDTLVIGKYGHAEGRDTLAGHAAHAEGSNTIATGDAAHAEGESTKATGAYSHTEGINTEASELYAHAEGQNSVASGISAHAEGTDSVASGISAHAEGQKAEATGFCSHAEGFKTKAYHEYAHAEGQETQATSSAAHAEGFKTKATNQYTHAEGYLTEATGWISHAEGISSKAKGAYSHTEGNNTEAIGAISHTEGENTKANKKCGHAEGIGTVSNKEAQHTQGKYNIIDNTTDGYAHIVGNGTSDTKRSNAHTLDWDGNAWFAGSGEFTHLILKSSTAGSTKRFKITVNDAGTITATSI